MCPVGGSDNENKYQIKKKMEGIRCTLGFSCLYSTCTPNWHPKNECCSAQPCSRCLDSPGTRAPQAPSLCCYPDTILSVLGSWAQCSYLCLAAIQDARVPLSSCSGRVLRARGANAPCQTLQEPQFLLGPRNWLVALSWGAFQLLDAMPDF